MHIHKTCLVQIAAASTLALVAAAILPACSSLPQEQSSLSEHYVSPQAEIQGSQQKINLGEVQNAFWTTKGQSDFKSWMAAFEKRVNEIYEGEGVVAIDATRENKRLVVTGFIDKDKKPGFQSGDDKLFVIEQTGEIANNDMPYRVVGYDGHPYYEGHRTILDNPFIQMMVLSHMMNSWGGRYYTNYNRYDSLRTGRDSFRQSPGYETQRAANKDFNSRFSTKADNSTLQSRRSFGSQNFSSSQANTQVASRRSWGTASDDGSTSPRRFGWGGRRSFAGGGFSFGRSRGWGGRRR